jgi:hypothetical protein
MRYLFPLLLLTILVTGCTKMPYDIQPSYIPPKNFEGYICEELIKEKKRIYPTFIHLREALDKEFDDNDVMWNYLGFSIVPPLDLTKNNKDKEDELADLTGHLYAIRDKSDELNCEILINLPKRKNLEKSHP